MNAQYDPPFQVISSELSFSSEGCRCAATLFLPEGLSTPPVLIMGHGFGATRTMRLPAYARRFASHGVAVLTFDYRCWGDSEGQPRQYISPAWQVKDWAAAIAFARSLPQVDGRRVALWGTAFSGGHVLVAAARDSQVAAVIAQGPIVSGLRTSLHLPLKHQLLGAWHGLRDVLSTRFRGRRHNVRVAGDYQRDGGTYAFANTPDALPGEVRLFGGNAAAYERMNFVPAAFAFLFLFYRPLRHVRRIRCPALILGMEADALFWPQGGRTAARRMRDATYEGFPIGHYGPYFDRNWEVFTHRILAFLKTHLNGGDN